MKHKTKYNLAFIVPKWALLQKHHYKVFLETVATKITINMNDLPTITPFTTRSIV